MREPEPIQLSDGQTLLILAKDGRVTEYTWDMGLPHVEFVKRRVGGASRWCLGRDSFQNRGPGGRDEFQTFLWLPIAGSGLGQYCRACIVQVTYTSGSAAM